MFSSEPAHPAAERVADDTDVRCGAGENGEVVGVSGVGRLLPDHTCSDPHGSRRCVDGDIAHSLGLEQDRVREVAERSGAVACPLRRDPEAVRPGEVHDGDDIVGRLRQDNRGRPLVDGAVPRLPCFVPCLVVGADELTLQVTTQRVHVELSAVMARRPS